MQRNPLRGAVYEKLGSCTVLAGILGWSGRKTRDIVSGQQMPTAKDIDELARALEITEPEEFVRVFNFLPRSPQKEDYENKMTRGE